VPYEKWAVSNCTGRAREREWERARQSGRASRQVKVGGAYTGGRNIDIITFKSLGVLVLIY